MDNIVNSNNEDLSIKSSIFTLGMLTFNVFRIMF